MVTVTVQASERRVVILLSFNTLIKRVQQTDPTDNLTALPGHHPQPAQPPNATTTPSPPPTTATFRLTSGPAYALQQDSPTRDPPEPAAPAAPAPTTITKSLSETSYVGGPPRLGGKYQQAVPGVALLTEAGFEGCAAGGPVR
ncbi:uncharacterized protein BO66DRAFT_448269 [Aspergillus aculeatinus CBS 121060]|uniref:Uncharacterized protein n=1 Tax=Aspergillus aculeatinus CBS 121060 TaxID=1448322 RepID=A0ACD1HDJ4_9EURO|nr:hypothetical protein BO66DRAFT_448269 [Aspergillus aculeatinus CBS 121060]RAH71552.1 hypothetical protein BO66DRAFT_448269 [Aspergillus aculeatinus CBS 121060]